MIFFNNYNELLRKTKLSFADIGASGDLPPRLINFKKFLKIFSFEPNYDEYQKLKKKFKQKNLKIKIYNNALGAKDQIRKLYITNGPFQTSFLKPNLSLVNKYANSRRFEINKTVEVNCKKLDNLNENFDIIKVDTQGFNYEVLQGAKSKLKNILAIEIEAEFIQIYTNQKLFEDTKKYLEAKNFIFVDFLNMRRWTNYGYEFFGDLIFTNALFIKNPNNIKINKKINYKKLLFICLLYNKLNFVKNLSKYLSQNEKIAVKKIILKKKILFLIPKILNSILLKINRIFNKNLDISFYT
jgi:FkbM family methyltransferase